MGAETRDQLIAMLAAEFELQGVKVKPGALPAIARAMASEDIEYGEIAMTAAVIGYAVATGQIT